MAINRALMNRQMYNMGGSSLETGAPDITLTGDMRPTYSAMRKQRLAGGGIAGLQNRQGYFLGKLVDKIRDDIIPNEIKENPVITALGGAALLNQFGLPDFITEAPVIGDYLSDDAGQNFLGDVLGKVVPGDTQFDTVFGNKIPFSYQDITSNPLTGGLDYLSGAGGQSTVDQMLGTSDYFPPLGTTGNTVANTFTNALKESLGINTTGGGGGGTNLESPAARDEYRLQQLKQQQLNANLMKALAAGSAAGAYVESQPKDELPTDTTGLNIPAIAQAARGTDADAAAAGLRFLPPQVARAANGGRIGFSIGGNYNKKQVEMMIKKGADNDLIKTYIDGILDNDINNIRKEIQDIMRNNKAEGGLMDLGGMEKEYREEGGFVPIGGKEKADDVPARLSKNEFVFTADAVRNAGRGDIDEGAQVMENVMRHLEAGGTVSPDSQGLEGAREMFATSQQLEKRII